MKWISRIIAVASTVLLGCFWTAAAGDLSGEKIGIIDEIVNTKIKEAKGADALSEVLDAVAEKFPLDTNEESAESSAFIEELQEQARKKYPATNQELEDKYRPIAERSYPVYNTGDHVSVIYLLHGKPFAVSGQYYRQDSRFVWIGSKKILKTQLGGEYASRFDQNRTKQLRASYVAQNIRRYHQQKDLLFKMLKSQNQEKISELRGEIKFNGKWLPPRKVVLEKYAAAFARQNNSIAELIQKAKDSPDYNEKNKILESVIQEYSDYKAIEEVKTLQEQFKQAHINSIIANAIQQAKNASDYNEKSKILESVIQKYPDHLAVEEAKTLRLKFAVDFIRKMEEVKNILACCSQRNIDFDQLKDKYQINLMERDVLSRVQFRFRGIPGRTKLQSVLENAQQIFVGKVIANGIGRADASQDLEEKIRILKALLASCPAHPQLAQVRTKLQEAERQYLAILVARAKQQAEEEGKIISPGSVNRNAAAYQTDIARVMSDFRHGDTMANNIYQQIQNGTYRTVQMLEVIARKFGCPSSSIDRVMSDFRHGDTMANNIYQQIQNGTYRTVQMLEVIARKLNCPSSSIDRVMSDFRHGDTMANNIYQQIQNGTYRTVQMLEVIARK